MVVVLDLDSALAKLREGQGGLEAEPQGKAGEHLARSHSEVEVRGDGSDPRARELARGAEVERHVLLPSLPFRLGDQVVKQCLVDGLCSMTVAACHSR